jgi:antitoxin ChpS
MAITRLRKVGGSTVVAIPPALLDELHLAPESSVDLTVENGRLVVQPARASRTRYTLAELLAKCDPDAPLSDEERAWAEAPSMGEEQSPWPDSAPPEPRQRPAKG